MNTINIIPGPIAGDGKVFITVTSEDGRSKSVRIKDITESFDFELSTHPTCLTESEAKDFLRVHLEDLIEADLSEEEYYVILAPHMFNNVPITQYIAVNEKDPTVSIITDKINMGSWFEFYQDAAAALDKLPSSLQGCKIKRITLWS